MNDKLFGYIIGFCLIASGIGIIVKEGFYDSRFDYYFDFSGIKWPFGIFLVVLGGFFICRAYRNKSKNINEQ